MPRTKLTLAKLLKAARRFSARKAASRGFRPAKKYVVRLAGRVLPSKAVVGMALGLRSSEFSGGRAHVGRMLAKLGVKLLTLATVALVACSAAKLSQAAPALDLYRGDFFRKAAAWAALNCDDVAILSAKHGLVRKTAVVAPYDQKLTGRKVEAATWGAKVLEQLRAAFDVELTTFVLMAGKAYTATLTASELATVDLFAGMGLGDRKGWLRRALEVV